jgi:hypothetical protein
MKRFIILLLAVTFYSCDTAEKLPKEPTIVDSNSFETKEYYFPVEQLADGKVYEYVVVHEGEAYLSHYYHLQSEKDEKGNLFLIWKRYNQQMQLDQYIKEWVISDGVITQEYKFYVLDSATNENIEYPNNVSQNVVFPFKASLDSVMAYRFVCEVKLPPDFLTTKLIRDRKFNQSTTYDYKGEKVDAVAFTSQNLYDIENEKEGGFWQLKKGTVEIYAKGIGLVFSEEKTSGQKGSEVIVLNEIYSVEEFEKLKLK